MKVDAASVKKLREQTGAGVLDCKKALDKTNGVFETAAELLREKGFAKAAKKILVVLQRVKLDRIYIQQVR